ncbi:hypothetical protein [Tellurirhabdus bombi]|uniref:hypothetical protein n=1 Tax=Tellurirhabdus bombi TaxID=2907205 RepID=UPI001F4834DB|nr:hypothetical protein [Tellurirhabdus bombi]
MNFLLDTVSVVKVGITLALALASWLLVTYPDRFRSRLEARPNLTIWGAFVLLRLVPFVVVYLILNFAPRSDTDFFYVKALAAYQGKMVYRDFLSYHAPLFGYFISLPLFIWNNAKVLVPFMAIFEAIIVWATYRYYRPTKPDALLQAVLYYLLPLPFVAMILSSEEDIWFWGFGLITLVYASRQSSSLKIGLLWGLAMITIKSMLIVLLLPLFFLVKNKVEYVLGLAIIGVPTLVILYLLMGDAFLMPLQHSGYHMAPNIVSVTRPLLSGLYNQVSLTRLNTISLFITMGAASYVAIRYRHLGYKRVFPSLFILTFGIFMLVQPSAPGYYIFTYMVVVLFELMSSRDKRFSYEIILLNILLVVQPIIWVIYAGMKNYDSLAVVFSAPSCILDYSIQVVEVLLLLSLVRRTFTHLQSLNQATDQAYSTNYSAVVDSTQPAV